MHIQQPQKRQQSVVQIWRPRKYFSYFFFSVKYAVVVIFHAAKVLVPAGFIGVVWVVKAVFKLIILFFALIVLLLGPKIGLPRAVYQVCATRPSNSKKGLVGIHVLCF